jgi:hypothetical protein
MQPSGGPWVNREPMRPSSRSIERSRRNIDLHDSVEGCGIYTTALRAAAGVVLSAVSAPARGFLAMSCSSDFVAVSQACFR